MREIKFRAWNEKEGMVYIDDLYWFEEEGVHDGNGEGHNRKYELMQFTGLYDVNGKEVYEGDIILQSGPKSARRVVEFRNGNAVGTDPRGYIVLSFIRDACEVIGNIYENPDLDPTKPEAPCSP